MRPQQGESLKFYQFMKNKNCPWCGHKVGFIKLLLLDDQTPTACKNCGKFLKNSSANLVIPAVITVVLFAASFYLIDIDAIFSVALLLLFPVLRFALAEPIKYSLKANAQHCSRCGQTNVRFKNSFAKICDNCLLLEPE